MNRQKPLVLLLYDRQPHPSATNFINRVTKIALYEGAIVRPGAALVAYDRATCAARFLRHRCGLWWGP
jgi:hypothetical protein